MSMCQYGTGQRASSPVGPALVRLGVPVQVGRLGWRAARRSAARGACPASHRCRPPSVGRGRRPEPLPVRRRPPAPGSPSPGRSRPTAPGPRGRAAGRPPRAAPAGPGRSCAPSAAGGPPRRTPSRRRQPGADAPGAPPGLPGLERDQVPAGPERVRRAGHRLDRDRPAVPLAGRVSPVKTCHQPNAASAQIAHAAEPSGAERVDRRAAVGVADHVAEGGVQLGRADPARAR